ncbi:MAG: hypothetical protein HYW63_01005 [Candidatus Levybacteria bacterium]|nr:hypothetical protein [Candidatus Levybacteria bacterium]
MAVGERPPIPAEVTGIAPEVQAWAEEQLGLSKPRRSKIVDAPTDIQGVSLRVERGTDTSGITSDQVVILDTMGREAAWIEQQHDERLPEVKEGIILYAGELGVIGIHRDPDHGNFNVNAVAQREVLFDDPVIKESIGEEAAGQVYVPRTVIALTFDGELETSDGTRLTPQSAVRIIRYALLGGGVDERFLKEHLLQRTDEARRNRRLAQLIVDGVPVEGIVISMKPRVEIDNVDKYRPIEVKRPRRRKNLIPRRVEVDSAQSVTTS